MSSSSPRSTSPVSLIPFRFTSRSEDSHSLWKGKENGDILFRRGPLRSIHKGKEPASGREINGSTLYGPDSSNLGSSELIDSWSSKPSYENKSNAHMLKRGRGSILGAASDALGLKFGRRKQPIRQNPTPIVLPDVIDISARRRDPDDEERERLRDIAAQSIFGQVITRSPSEGNIEEEMDEAKDELSEENAPAPSLYPVNGNAQVSNVVHQSPRASSHSIVPTPPPVVIAPNRYRSRSLLIPSRTNSVSFNPLPLFPAAFNAVNQYQQAGTMLYKYYHPSSLRIFALSKNWRHRFMLLSSPGINRNSGPTASYLHLFKSAAGDDVEMERLEINENSVVFIAEEEVGGRKHVVKVGGVDAGMAKKELNPEEGGRTMWFLHLSDPAEAQKWITVIKNSILGQRTVRAGLGPPSTTPGAVEPRGDMDVMLSMQAQGLITPPTSARSPQNESQADPQSERSYTPSMSSHHSQATVSRSLSSGAVSTFKGLFTGPTRPRSASRATSIASRERDPQEESFGSMGNQLLRSTNIDPTLATHSVAAYAGLPFTGSIMPPEHRLERKITTERPIHWETQPTIARDPTSLKPNRTNKALSLGSLSLQPPPRKRWTSAGSGRLSTNSSEREKITPPNDAVVQGKAETEPPSSPAWTDFTFGTPEQRPRAPSLHSVSTMASGENHAPVERSSSSTKRSSVKRWSRQGVLPRRLTPPAGPPPSVPTNGPSASRGGRLSVELAPTRTRSRTSSSHSASSRKSFVSSLPSFSKRASGSSVFSNSSLPQSPSGSRPPSTQGHRLSMPPPRPAPTSALPPAPLQDPPKSAPFPSKPSFRETVAHRGFRLSLIAPRPPPSGNLPPRPDEISHKHHKRNSSTGSHPYATSLDVIPASPQPPKPIVASPPFPPPAGPLPPTPVTSEPTKRSHSRPNSRHFSFKQRIRILSAPSPAPHSPKDGNDVLDQAAPLRRPRPETSTIVPSMVSPPLPVSPPQTPIAEKITQYHDESSFLQLQTPVTPHLPPPRPISSEIESEVTSLSPPPRRGSKQITVVGSDVESPAAEDRPAAEESEHRIMSLSRPGSVVSLGIVSM